MHTELNRRVVDQLGSGIRRVAILGTGLIGASVGLALREAGFSGAILGWDSDREMLAAARERGAVDARTAGEADDDPFVCALAADVVVLAGPVFAIADWLEQLAPVLAQSQLVTDVGSVKSFLVERAGPLYNREKQAAWLPGHPMAGKEISGAWNAEGGLFRGATWLFTGASEAEPVALPDHPYVGEWLGWVERFGARCLTLAPAEHDRICAAASHLPQMLASALSAMLEQQFGSEKESGALKGIGGRALREMTRLGASPYSMWRDVAIANQGPIAAALLRLEQELAHLRENLREPVLREIFAEANAFRWALGTGAGEEFAKLPGADAAKIGKVV